MDIICTRCANTDCECVPYDTECDQNFKEKVKTKEVESEQQCQNNSK